MGQDVSFVVRPENIELHRIDGNAAAASENVIEGQVTGRVYLGDVAEYTVDLGGRFKLLARSHPGLGFATGDKVRVHLPAERTIAIHA
jgi:ABC-type Fe3+/spermidine/putrescine transport system ATPase subunit